MDTKDTIIFVLLFIAFGSTVLMLCFAHQLDEIGRNKKENKDE